MKNHARVKSPEEAAKVKRCAVTGKKKSTHAQAKKDAKYLKYNKKYPDAIPTAYKCTHCGWWHVGNL